MGIAMAAFAVEDTLVKMAAQAIPIGQILVFFGLGGALFFAALAHLKSEPLFTHAVLARSMRYRVGFEITGRLFYVLAIALTPLSSATVILQATPIVVVAGAALFFQEKVGFRRWFAIMLGLLGVVIVIQPGAEEFSSVSTLAIIGMLGFAGRDLASRAAPPSLSTSILGLYGFLSIVVAGVIFSLWDASDYLLPNFKTSIYLLGATLAGVLAYTGLMKAMRTGEISAVTPFRYSRLLFGIGLGVFLFDETISPNMLIGSCFVVASGIFILLRAPKVSA